jgi:hypothetical protein
MSSREIDTARILKRLGEDAESAVFRFFNHSDSHKITSYCVAAALELFQ